MDGTGPALLGRLSPVISYNRSASRPSQPRSPAQQRPCKQNSAHAGGICKNTQRRNGVRMRYRRANARRNRKGRGMGDTPSRRQTIDADCYSRALLATLFCAACRPECGLYHPVLCCFLTTCTCPTSCCQTHPAGKPAQNTRRNGICNRQCGAAPSRRAHGISSKKSNDHRT